MRAHSILYLLLLQCALIFFGCTNESVYRGGMGAFKDYEALSLYRSTDIQTLNYTNQAFDGDVFEHLVHPLDLFLVEHIAESV